MSRPRRLALAAAAVAVLLVAALVARGGGGDERVRRGELVLTTEATGTLEAIEAVTIGKPTVSEIWDFKVTRLAPEGTEVAAGTPLVSFDTSDLERRLQDESNRAEQATRELEKATAALELGERDAAFAVAEAEAALRKAELAAAAPAELVARKEREKTLLDLDRAREALARRQAELVAARRQRDAELAQLRGTLARAQARVAALGAAIEKMTVLAPHAGTVIYLSDWQGEKVKVGDQVWRPVISLPNLAALRAVLDVAEVDAGRVGAGQRVKMVLDAHPDHPFGGVVERVDSSVRTLSATSQRKVVRALVTLDQVDAERMRPGMRLRADLEVARLADVVLLPRVALRETRQGPVVERLGWLGARELRPRLGRANRELVEVLDGLAPGDRVRRLEEGAG